MIKVMKGNRNRGQYMNAADGHTTSAKVHCKFQESGMVNIDHTANHATLV